MDQIPTWMYVVVAAGLIFATLIIAIRNEGGIKRPYQLLGITLLTVFYVFSLTFIQDVRPLLGLDLKGGVSVVLEAKGNPSADELDIAVDVIRSRVDALGVAEPDISRQGNNIVVDLPGVKDARKAQELIGQTAELRFRQVAENQNTDPQIQAVLQQVAATYQAEQSGSKSSVTTTTKKSNTTTTSTSSSTTTTGVGGGPGSSKSQVSTTSTTSPVEQSITPISTPIQGQQNSVTLQCGGTNPTSVQLSGDLTKATPREDDIADNPILAVDKDGVPYALCPAVLKGDIVKTASPQVDTSGQVSVGVELTSKGGSDFTRLIGGPLSNQNVAIVLDSIVKSAPTIQPDLANGLTNNQLQITVGDGKGARGEVDDLVTVLKYGSLPVVLVQQTAQKVSPTLGTDQLRAGIYAGAFGLLLVIIYMLLYYRLLALVVVAGITLTGLSIYALVAFLGVSQGLTLSLSGAVGLIISLGVTVDSYVVYFEKLKDEVRQGRTIRASLDPAFRSSFKTILAADLVSLIGAVVLFYLASGNVRGFAFFLGLSTFLDLIISICFMHPMVKFLASKPKLITMKFFGLASALDKRDLTA